MLLSRLTYQLGKCGPCFLRMKALSTRRSEYEYGRCWFQPETFRSSVVFFCQFKSRHRSPTRWYLFPTFQLPGSTYRTRFPYCRFCQMELPFSLCTLLLSVSCLGTTEICH